MEEASPTRPTGDVTRDGCEVLRFISGRARETQQDATSSESRDPVPCRWTQQVVRLVGYQRALQEVHIQSLSKRSRKILVILHGWGGGMGFFYKSLPHLSQYCDIYAIDFLGMGGSSRPPFQMDDQNRVKRAEAAVDWFVQSLEEWRAERDLEQMVLLGHSLGAYLAGMYTYHHHERVLKLILLSPVGVLDSPIFHKPASPWWIPWVWWLGISPFSLVRLSGGLGRWIVARWVATTFPDLPSNEVVIMCAYVYDIWRRPASSENALVSIFASDTRPYLPLMNRIPEIDASITFIYGDKDWAKKEEAEILEQCIDTYADKRPTWKIVPHAGHYAQLQNPNAFNEIVAQALASA